MKKLLTAVTVLAVSTAQADVIHVDIANRPSPKKDRMRRNSLMKRILYLTVLLLGSLVGRANAQPCCPFGAYWPLDLGSLWTFTNTDPPFDVFFEAVLGPFPFDGNPDSVKLRFNLEVDPFSLIAANDGVTFTVLGSFVNDVPKGLLEDLLLSDFSDGDLFILDPDDTVFTVIRLWENLDHPLKAEYGVDPALKDVVLWVWYDTNFKANSQNVIVESGGGQAYPFGVTDIDFFQKDVGPIKLVGVGAELGDFDGRYDVSASFDCLGCATADGQVGIVEFLALLAQWGTVNTCDFDGGGVGSTDFLLLLANWGACP